MTQPPASNPVYYEGKGVPTRTAEEAKAIFRANVKDNDPYKEAKLGPNNFLFRVEPGDKLFIPVKDDADTVVTVDSPAYLVLTVLARDLSGAAPTDFDPTLLQPIEPEYAIQLLKPSVAATYFLCSVGNMHPAGFDRSHFALHKEDNITPGYETESEYSRIAREQTHGGSNFQVLVIGNAIWDSLDYSATK